MSETWPSGPELAAKNMRLFAQREGWPDGALQACEAITARHPGWNVTYSMGSSGSWKDAGYYALPHRHGHLQPWLYAATPEALETAIVDYPEDDG